MTPADGAPSFHLSPRLRFPMLATRALAADSLRLSETRTALDLPAASSELRK